MQNGSHLDTARRNKVVWQLPDDIRQVPKFGMDEKRRLLELFKQQKKSRKKARRPCLGGTTKTMNEEDGAADEDDDEAGGYPDSPTAVAGQRKLSENLSKSDTGKEDMKLAMEDSDNASSTTVGCASSRPDPHYG